MKCTYCDFPLSPTNINMPCPRCHNSTTSNPKFVVQQQIQGQGDNQTWTTDPYRKQIPSPFPEQAPFPQLGQLLQSAPPPAHQPQTRHASNLGFRVAGLCVFAGGLILILVYFMAIRLLPSSSASSYTTTPVVTENTPSTLLTAAPSPKIVPSPTTGAFPGQQYIDNSQMASSVNSNTAQPLQTTTTFKVNQKIYVTFNIHPNNKNGAVCLYWYLNNKNVTQFPFSVTANAKAGYSYAIYGGAGTAFVEIYWASTTTCFDKLLAQHVNFTVTPKK